MVAGSQQHGHVIEHADDAEGNWRDVFRVQHVWIVSATGVTKDVAWLGAVTPVERQPIHASINQSIE